MYVTVKCIRSKVNCINFDTLKYIRQQRQQWPNQVICISYQEKFIINIPTITGRVNIHTYKDTHTHTHTRYISLSVI